MNQGSTHCFVILIRELLASWTLKARDQPYNGLRWPDWKTPVSISFFPDRLQAWLGLHGNRAEKCCGSGGMQVMLNVFCSCLGFASRCLVPALLEDFRVACGIYQSPCRLHHRSSNPCVTCRCWPGTDVAHCPSSSKPLCPRTAQEWCQSMFQSKHASFNFFFRGGRTLQMLKISQNAKTHISARLLGARCLRHFRLQSWLEMDLDLGPFGKPI